MEVNEAKASIKYLRISPYKVRRVVNEIRGKNVRQALDILRYLPHRSSQSVAKLLKSAAANLGTDLTDLKNVFIKEIFVNEGPRGKRFQPKARGRVYQILKRTSHLHVKVSEVKGG